MLAEWLILFAIITFICFILSVYTMEDQPMLAIPIIMVGLLFSILCAYGVWAVDYVYVAYNSTIGNSSAYTYTTSYGIPYSFVFVLLFFIFVMLFVKSAFNYLRQQAEQKGELDLKNKRR